MNPKGGVVSQDATEPRLVSDGWCFRIVPGHAIVTIGALRHNASCWTGYRRPKHRLYTTMYLAL
eukprot:3136232-Prymnesium_polylepis.1